MVDDPEGTFLAVGLSVSSRSVHVVALVVAVIIARTARAEESRGPLGPDPYTGRYSAIGYVGLGTPIGGLGVEFEAMPIRGLSFSLGVGAGSFSFTELEGGVGPQVALMVRPRMVLGKAAIGVGFGPSEGGFRQRPLDISDSGGPVVSRDDDGVVWLNGEMFVERRNAGPVFWRFFVGYGREIASFGVTCHGDSLDLAACRDQSPRGLPYFGFALGVSLNTPSAGASPRSL